MIWDYLFYNILSNEQSDRKLLYLFHVSIDYLITFPRAMLFCPYYEFISEARWYPGNFGEQPDKWCSSV